MKILRGFESFFRFGFGLWCGVLFMVLGHAVPTAWECAALIGINFVGFLIISFVTKSVTSTST